MAKQIVYCKDCMKGMGEYPDKYFDLAIVDPVYGDVTKGGYMNNVESTARLAKAIQYNTAIWKQEKTDTDYFRELFRVSKNQIIWGGNYFTTSIQKDSQCWLVWDKKHPAGVSYADVELAWTSFNKASRIFRFLWNGMLQEDMKCKEKRIHPTQKPVALYEWILKNYAKEGNIILDTHVGSGSSRIAAYNLGYEYIGFEIDRGYFEDQEQRFENETRQLRLFV